MTGDWPGITVRRTDLQYKSLPAIVVSSRTRGFDFTTYLTEQDANELIVGLERALAEVRYVAEAA